MKAVLMSIHPKWCELIASGKKTVDIRKTKPLIDTPFTCFIYETQDKHYENLGYCFGVGKCFEHTIGKVIGEFVCDVVFSLSIFYSNPNDRLASREFPFTCLTDKEVMYYLGNGGDGYGWRISDLVIYDKPRELSEFSKAGFGHVVPLKRPPQSWMYVDLEERLEALDHSKERRMRGWRR